MRSIYDVTEQDEQEMRLLYSDVAGKAYGYAPGGDTYVACSLDARARNVQALYVEYEGATFWPYVLYGSIICIKRPNVGDRIPIDVLPIWVSSALFAIQRLQQEQDRPTPA